MVKLIQEKGWTESVDLVEGGHTTVFFTDSELEAVKADFEVAMDAGVDLKATQWMSKDNMKLFGGHNLWPLKFVTHLYRLAKETTGSFDLSIHTHTPVMSIYSSSSPCRWAVQTHCGVLNCSYVIHATNVRDNTHLCQVMATRATASAEDIGKCSWDRNKGFEYWFPRPVIGVEKPLIIVGGGREVSWPGFEYYQTDDSIVNHQVGDTLRKFLPSAFPGVFEKDQQPEEEWTGIMGYIKLQDPFVSPVTRNSDARVGTFAGQYISAGYSGHGMPRAFACAEIIASMIVANMSRAKWQPPKWFPDRFLMSARDAKTGL
ncbi:hypothetical protein B0H10DRAFT_1950919 [Mycena sp. CBHHK59/15]|nr:hypothetical protein B0H10DRAFT_1950919 [Mycena sp. CBHHK59/15]